MLNSIRKDKNRRILVKRFEIKRLQDKVFSQDIVLSENLTNFFSKKDLISAKSVSAKQTNNLDFYSALSQKTFCYPRNSSKNRVQNRCIETGRSKAVLRFCKLSRICFRDKASKGIIPGVTKASW